MASRMMTDKPPPPSARQFTHDDPAYFVWIANHPLGFVLNVRRRDDPLYMVLHRASCNSISSMTQGEAAYDARSYRKICATTVDELRAWVSHHGRPDGSFSKRCQLCCPP
jgi:hypothetical protein